MNLMEYVIGIDIGTTNTKAVAYTRDGRVLASAGAGYAVITDAGGRHELDPERLLEAFAVSLGEVLGKVGEDAAVGVLAGISFSCAFHSLLAVDEEGKPLMRAMTWADLRPSPQAKALKGSEAGRRIYRATGTPVHAMSPLCKLLWLRAERPELFQRAARFIGIKEYIWWRLFGKYQVDHGIASATGLLDIRLRDWYPEALELAGIGRERLSEPVPCTHRESGLLPAAAEWLAGKIAGGAPAGASGGEAGLASGVSVASGASGAIGASRAGRLWRGLPFIIGGGDGCLANLGSGAVRPGETALTIGTSGAVRMTVAVPEDDPEERIFTYILSDSHYCSGGATNNGGNVLQWFFEGMLGVKQGNEEEWQRRMEEAEKIPPGCEGLIFLPYLQGERAPVWDAEGKGVFFGVRAVHDHRHFTRACLEGIGYALCQIGESLEATIGPIQAIYASGGFTRSGMWLQLMADIFFKRVLVSGVADASATGAAIMGFHALGMIGDPAAVRIPVQVERVYEPDAARHARYLDNYKKYIQLYGRLKDLM